MLFTRLRDDIRAIRARDPAARSAIEVLLCYPGLHAVLFHRLAHAGWQRGFVVGPRLIAHIARLLTAIKIHPGARIGRRLFIDHGSGTVIGETAELGDDVTLYHGVTLGGVSLEPGKRHPTLEDGVIVGSGAQVLGPITVGADARIGANSVVVKDVPPGVTMVGVPARPVAGGARPSVSHAFAAYGMAPGDLPDPLARLIESMKAEIAALRGRLARIEERTGAHESGGDGNGLRPESRERGAQSPAERSDGAHH